MSVVAGQRLGPYAIQSLLGAGGMGEVYKARDTRLNRTVALKVLPSAAAADPERRARFEREAQAVAALNHPHICTLHDIGQEDGVTYLVMEHLVGDTLAARLQKGPLPIAQVLTLGAQIAGALATAHREGIVHRDLKPANVMLTSAGAKLLDFGLAKLTAPETAGLAPSWLATTREGPATALGTILGTLPYMAPEQLEGKEADARSDVWALGCVLYEMATGCRAFEGETGASLITAIMSAEPPPVAASQPLTPAAFEHVVRQCLAKDPDERWQSAADVRRELAWIAESSGVEATRPSAAATGARAALRRWRVWPVIASGVTVALVVAALAGRWIGWQETAPVTSSVVRSSLELPPDGSLVHGSGTNLSVSPDGTWLAWIGQPDSEQRPALHVMSLSDGTSARVNGTEGADQPMFSPDGRWIAFVSDRRLRKVPAAGGLVVDVADLATHGPPMGASWTTEGGFVLGSSNAGLTSVSAEGAPPKPVLTVDATREVGHRLPFVLPGGRTLLLTTMPHFWGVHARVEALVLASGARKVLIEDCADGRLLPTGHLVCLRQGTLLAAPFDGQRLELRGPVVPVVRGVRQSLNRGMSHDNSGAGELAISSTGLLVFAPGGIEEDSPGELVMVDGSGQAEPVAGFNHPLTTGFARFSPDGRRIAFAERARTGLLWLFDIERRTSIPLSRDGLGGPPVWSPDGRHVVVSWSRAGALDLWLVPTDGGREWTRLTRHVDHGWLWPSSWSPDGRTLAVVRSDGEGDVALLDLATQRMTPFLPAPARFPEFSPDGRWLAYVTEINGREQVYLTALPEGRRVFAVSSDGGTEPAWSRDGTTLYYRSRSENALWSVSVGAGETPVLGRPRRLFAGPFWSATPVRGWDVHPGGRGFLFARFGPWTPPSPVTRLSLVHNWFAELERLSPTPR
jgi:eukaryotic-like serine/threonine-protein kinase